MKITYISYIDFKKSNASYSRVYNNCIALGAICNNISFFGKNGLIKFTTGHSINLNLKKYLFKSFIDVITSKYVVCYNLKSPHMIFLLVVGFLSRTKIISDITEWHSPDSRFLLFKKIKIFDVFVRMRILNKLTYGNILISSGLIKYYGRSKNIIIPPLSEKKNVQVNYNCKNTRLIYFGNSGGDSKDKVSQIFNLRNSLKSQVPIILIGDKVNKSLLKNNDRQFNWVDKSTLDSLIKKSDILILLRENNRLNETSFSTKLVESISNGLKVICSHFPGIDSHMNNYLSKQVFVININNENYEEFINESIAFEYANIFYNKNYKNEFKELFIHR